MNFNDYDTQKKYLYAIFSITTLSILMIGISTESVYATISHSYHGIGQSGFTGAAALHQVKDATIDTGKHIDHIVYVSGGTEWTMGTGTYEWDSGGTETLRYLKAFIDDGTTADNWHILDTTAPTVGTDINSAVERDTASGSKCWRSQPHTTISWYSYCLTSNEAAAHIGGISGTTANSTTTNGLPGYFKILKAKTTGSYELWSTFGSAHFKCLNTVNYFYDNISINEFKTGRGDTTIDDCTSAQSPTYRPHGEYD